MNGKFVKPTTAKILVTLLLGVILSISLSMSTVVCNFAGNCFGKENGIAQAISAVLSLPLVILDALPEAGGVIITVGYLYLISAAIISAYRKFRRNK